MLCGSSMLSEFCTSLSKVLTLWHCVKVKQCYLCDVIPLCKTVIVLCHHHDILKSFGEICIFGKLEVDVTVMQTDFFMKNLVYLPTIMIKCLTRSTQIDLSDFEKLKAL